MNVSLLETRQSGDWLSALERLPDADVYHLPRYYRAAEANGEGQALAFVAEADGELFFHAFLRRAIEQVGAERVAERWSDLETAYGYSGPLATCEHTGFLARAWDAFDAWCRDEGVVAEFIRFSPLLDNERFAPAAADVVADRETVAVRLDVGEDELWHSYLPVQRNMVRKAQARGLRAELVSLAEGLAGFRRLYEKTMARVGADAYYALSDGYYGALVGLGDGVRIVRVLDGHELAAAALFLQHGKRLHYHLSGSYERYRSAAPTNLLLHAAASWGREQGFEVLHLGGGRTPAPDDPLLRFKAGLSRVRLTFQTGRRVHDRRAYDHLCSLWLDQARPRARPGYFLLYRLEIGC
jgi:Acetyltransferase (GNAT) domain